MSENQKNPVSEPGKHKRKAAAAVPETQSAAAPAVETTEAVPEISKVARKKKRFYRPAVALLGLFGLLLSLVGAVSLVVLGVNSYHGAQEKLKTELNYFLEPLTYYTPLAFEDVNKTAQDALILSALYQVTEQERVRQLQEGDLEYAYDLDDYSRLAVPIDKVAEAYASLYGVDAKPYYHTIGDAEVPYSTYEYDSVAGYYYVPVDSSESLYNVFVDRVTKRGDLYLADVCYVPESNLKYDGYGEPLALTRAQAQYIQQFSVRNTESGWAIAAVTDLEAGGSTITTATTAVTESATVTTVTRTTHAAATAKTVATTAKATTKATTK